jgi:hypothetical protein
VVLKKIAVLCAAFILFLLPYATGQERTQTSTLASTSASATLTSPSAPVDKAPVPALMQHLPWDRGVFVDGGFGAHSHPGTGYHFLNAGFRLGKVLTHAAGPGMLRGQFEYAIELAPYWQAFTPREVVSVTTVNPPQTLQYHTGGTFTGFSITPILLRWDLVRWRHVMPWVQGGGGMIWTDHKFPPIATSVWNFSPQFGVGIHYFVRPKQAITFGANAEHISSASLGDKNPGVNASVQFQIGYTWWK